MLSENIKASRKNKGFTQEELARINEHLAIKNTRVRRVCDRGHNSRLTVVPREYFTFHRQNFIQRNLHPAVFFCQQHNLLHVLVKLL